MTGSPAALPPELAAWIGRETRRTDTVTPRLAAAYRATLDPQFASGDVLPSLFWCLAPDIVLPVDLGPDGHPRTGLLGPPVPYPRRMWAGGELKLNGTLAVGDAVTKISTVADIAFKTGSTGPLAFLTMRHEYNVGGATLVSERQDIVYREAPGRGSTAEPVAPVAEPGPPLAAWDRVTDPTLLFRYSALTFNGHRIHYDEPYAAGVEGYPGLVVHGPLQATWMLYLATSTLGRSPKRFAYRGRAPLICGHPVRVEARQGSDSLLLRVVDTVGRVTMTATAYEE